jgi:hypothetical protein
LLLTHDRRLQGSIPSRRRWCAGDAPRRVQLAATSDPREQLPVAVEGIDKPEALPVDIVLALGVLLGVGDEDASADSWMPKGANARGSFRSTKAPGALSQPRIFPSSVANRNRAGHDAVPALIAKLEPVFATTPVGAFGTLTTSGAPDGANAAPSAV